MPDQHRQVQRHHQRPNREDDEEYIVRLVGRVVSVSVETVRLIQALPEQVVREPGPA